MFTPVLCILCTPDEVTSIQGHHARRQEGVPYPRLQAKRITIRLKFSPFAGKPSPVLGLYLPKVGRVFFFCTFPKVSIGLTVASLTVSLVQSQPVLPDLILQNLDLLKENK